MVINALLLAIREIRRNLLRSSLTALGIIIGVAAVIIMVTLGNGATERVTTDISALGSNLLQVRPGQRFRGPGRTQSTAPPLSLEDVDAITTQIAGIEPAAANATLRMQAI
ncbi:MAG: ABC transporter permease, partial [Gammaproteobacteria bacterium]